MILIGTKAAATKTTKKERMRHCQHWERRVEKDEEGSPLAVNSMWAMTYLSTKVSVVYIFVQYCFGLGVIYAQPRRNSR